MEALKELNQLTKTMCERLANLLVDNLSQMEILKEFLIKSVNARRKAEYSVLSNLDKYDKRFIYNFAKLQGRTEATEYIIARKVFGNVKNNP